MRSEPGMHALARCKMEPLLLKDKVRETKGIAKKRAKDFAQTAGDAEGAETQLPRRHREREGGRGK